jgi:hypothetical protein
MGFTECLTIAFVVLKSLGDVNWSWWLVFAPELAAGVIYIITFGFALAVVKAAK